MQIIYPRWIPNPETDNGLPEILVQDEKSHQLRNRSDYEEALAYVPPSNANVEEIREGARNEELNRVVKLILTFPTAKDVAKEIANFVRKSPRVNLPAVEKQAEKSKPAKKNDSAKPAADDESVPVRPPTFEEVQAAGPYTEEAANRIVAREQGKFERGEQPYGPNPVTGDPVI